MAVLRRGGALNDRRHTDASVPSACPSHESWITRDNRIVELV